MKASWLFASLFLVAVATAAAGVIRRVPSDSPTIQAAIDAAADGDTVVVAEGRYYENINFMGKAIVVGSAFVLDADRNHIPQTIIDGSQPSHPDSGSTVSFLHGEDTASVLCGVTVTGGTGIYYPSETWGGVRAGGGIVVYGAGARICDNIIEGNECRHQEGTAIGGGLIAGGPSDSGWTVVERNTIRNNILVAGLAAHGGGIFALENCRIRDNIIEGNSVFSEGPATGGGGISVGMEDGSPSVTFVLSNVIRACTLDCPNGSSYGGGANAVMRVPGSDMVCAGNEISENTITGGDFSRGAGYAMDLFAGTTGRIEKNRVTRNVALGDITQGGGVYLELEDVCFIRDNIIAENRAQEGGGVLTAQDGLTFLVHNTIVGNLATSAGGAIACYATRVVLVNSILWGNSAGDGNEIEDPGGGVTIHASSVQNWGAASTLNLDPRFVHGSLYELGDSSECLGMGVDSVLVYGTWVLPAEVDVDGTLRPDPPGSRPDLGAQEHWSEKPPQHHGILLRPAVHDFRNVRPGTTSDTLELRISNIAATDRRITAVTMSTDVFQLADHSPFPLLVPPYQSQDIGVVFRPTAPGLAVCDTIRVFHDDPPSSEATALVQGRGSDAARPATWGSMYGIPVSLENMCLFEINTLTGEARMLESLSPDPPPAFHGFAVRRSDTVMYAAYSLEDETRMYRVSSASGDLEFCATIPLGGVTAMAFTERDELYFATEEGMIFRLEDLGAGITQIGGAGVVFTGLAISPATGALWACAGDSLFEVDKATAKADFLGTSGLATSFSSITFNAAGALYGLYGETLVAFDKVAAEPMIVGVTGQSCPMLIAMRGDIVTALEETARPLGWALHQNYPNPFNAQTVVRYELPEGTHVRLDVYDLHGRSVATLVDAKVAAGTHRVVFDARGLASGVYFYRIQAGANVATRKLIYLR